MILNLSARKAMVIRVKKWVKILLSVVLAVAVIIGGVFTFLEFYHKDYERAEDTVFSVLQITDIHILNDEKRTPKRLKLLLLWLKNHSRI